MIKPQTEFCGLRLFSHISVGPEKHEDWQQSYTEGRKFLGASPIWRKVKCSKLCCVLGVQNKTLLGEIFTSMVTKRILYSFMSYPVAST